MIAPTSIAEVTLDEFSSMADSSNFELVDGQLVERKMSTLSCRVEAIMSNKLQNHTEPNNLGPVWTGTMGFACFPDRPRHARRPDVSFVKAVRMTAELWQTSNLPIAPEAPLARRRLPLSESVRPQDEQARPIYAVWEITLQCDLACRHCGSPAGHARALVASRTSSSSSSPEPTASSSSIDSR